MYAWCQCFDDPLRPRHPCVRYDLSPMSQVAQRFELCCHVGQCIEFKRNRLLAWQSISGVSMSHVSRDGSPRPSFPSAYFPHFANIHDIWLE